MGRLVVVIRRPDRSTHDLYLTVLAQRRQGNMAAAQLAPAHGAAVVVVSENRTAKAIKEGDMK